MVGFDYVGLGFESWGLERQDPNRRVGPWGEVACRDVAHRGSRLDEIRSRVSSLHSARRAVQRAIINRVALREAEHEFQRIRIADPVQAAHRRSR